LGSSHKLFIDSSKSLTGTSESTLSLNLSSNSIFKPNALAAPSTVSMALLYGLEMKTSMFSPIKSSVTSSISFFAFSDTPLPISSFE
jgi:hypothetical protein